MPREMTLPLTPEAEPRFFQKLAEAQSIEDLGAAVTERMEAPPLVPGTLWPSPGVYHGMKPGDYHATKEIDGKRIVSKSLLWDFEPNPLRWLSSPPKEVTAAMKWGSLVDCLALTPSLFDLQYSVCPATYEAPESAKKDAAMILKPWNWNANACKEWRDGQPSGIEIITGDDHIEAMRAARIIHEHPICSAILNGAATQVAMRFDLPASVTGEGIHPAKALMDIVPSRNGDYGDALCDLKTVGTLDSPRELSKTIFKRGYHVQAAFYLDLWNALTGEDRCEWMMIFQLSSPPYDIAVIRLDTEAILEGQKWWAGAVRKWAKCVESSEYTSPWDGITPIGLPKWAGSDEWMPKLLEGRAE